MKVGAEVGVEEGGGGSVSLDWGVLVGVGVSCSGVETADGVGGGLVIGAASVGVTDDSSGASVGVDGVAGTAVGSADDGVGVGVNGSVSGEGEGRVMVGARVKAGICEPASTAGDVGVLVWTSHGVAEGAVPQANSAVRRGLLLPQMNDESAQQEQTAQPTKNRIACKVSQEMRGAPGMGRVTFCAPNCRSRLRMSGL
ncbi:MAG TPA: hypothetical protein ENN99_11560 [Chloroflexi bacterium]|nr:hypothetical protein [Chloroflexota bacterium]